MSEKEMTAIQWLQERIRERQALAEPGSKPSFKPLFDKALQIEREQIIKAHFEGQCNNQEGYPWHISKEYFNETYQQNDPANHTL